MSFDLLTHTMRLSKALLETEMHGIRIDTQYAESLGKELEVESANLLEEMRSVVADETYLVEMDLWFTEIKKRKTLKGKQNVTRPTFNWGSSNHLRKLLYDILDLPITRRTPKGAASTKAGDLAELQEKHPVVRHIVEANKLRMYKTTFIDGVLSRAENGRIYPEFKEIGTTTGRISHVNPNMGNMPAKDPRWSRIRGIFLPDEGEVICSVDYSQLEVCIAAHYSRDKNLLKVVNEGASLHDITAEGLGIERPLAKTMNFAAQYGCGTKKIQSILNCSESAAQEAFDKYWETYSGLKRLMDECKTKVDKGEDIISLFGRKRRFATRKRRPWDKDYRRSFNALIQGTGSDFTSYSLYTVADTLKKKGIGRGGFSVHDELVMFANKERSEEVCAITSQVMIEAAKTFGLSVPLATEEKGGLLRWEK